MTTLTSQEQELVTLFTERLPKLLDDHPELEPQLYHVFLKTFARKEEVAAVQKELTEFRGEMGEFREEAREQFARVNTHINEVDQRLTGGVDTLTGRVDSLQVEVRAGFAEVAKQFEQVGKQFEQVGKQFEQVGKQFEQVGTQFEQVGTQFERLGARMEQGFKDAERDRDQLGARWGIRNERLFRETMTSVLEKSFGVKVETRSLNGEQFDLIISNGEHIIVEIAASAKRNAKERLGRKRQLYIEETGIMPARFIFAVAVINDRRSQLLREAGFEVIVPDDEADEADDGE